MKVETRRRRLADLFVRGKEVQIDDGQGEPVTLWVRKMTPVDAETAFAKAGAVRSQYLSLKNQQPPSDEWLSLCDQFSDLDRAALVEWALASKMAVRRPIVEAKVAFEDEWSKENYLRGLEEIIGDPEFPARVEANPDDPEIERVRSEYQRYVKQCDELAAKEEQGLRSEVESMSTDELRTSVLDEMVRIQADTKWLVEYRKCQVWLSTYDNQNRRFRVFEQRSEVDEVQEEVLEILMLAAAEINVPETEGKDSPPTPLS